MPTANLEVRLESTGFVGMVVPIPTLPSDVIRSFSVPLVSTTKVSSCGNPNLVLESLLCTI